LSVIFARVSLLRTFQGAARFTNLRRGVLWEKMLKWLLIFLALAGIVGGVWFWKLQGRGASAVFHGPTASPSIKGPVGRPPGK